MGDEPLIPQHHDKRHKRSHTSQYTGVSWRADEQRWQAQICIDRKTYGLGRFRNEEDANKAYQDAIKYGVPSKVKAPSALDKIMAKVQISETGCWLWQGRKDRDGYARVQIENTRTMLHRWMYQHDKGTIPEELVVDHLCRVRHCVNPDHMELVTRRENTLRGDTYPARNAAKTHCPQGHPYDTENTKIKRGQRHCITCTQEQNHIQDQKRKIKRAQRRTA